MSRFVVTKQRRAPYRSKITETGSRLPARCIPVNGYKNAEDVPYTGPAVLEIPQGTDRAILNRSGDRKKIT